MEFTQTQREQIQDSTRPVAEATATLAQGETDLSVPGMDSSEFVSHWREAVNCSGADTRFKTRLSLASGQPPGRPDRDAGHCGWLPSLERYLGSLPVQPEADHRALRSDEPLPFEDVLVPFVSQASEELPEFVSDRISTDGVASFERWGLQRLVLVSARALYVEFKTYLTTADPTALFSDRTDWENSTTHYSVFVERLLDGGLIDVFVSYPLLGEYVVTVLDQWKAFVTMFARRLADDYRTLEDTFGDSDRLQSVTDIDVGIADPHSRGQTVVEVTFDSDTTLFYKPRDVGPEAAFKDTVEWLADHDYPYNLSAPEVVQCDGYGWVAGVDNEPCPSPDAVEKYYRRVGALLFVLYLFNGTDCHLENIVASGEYPVLVDCETLFHPDVEPARMPADQFDTDYLGERERRAAVLRTGLLPQLAGSQDRPDLSGIGATTTQEGATTELTWQYVNTDRMTVTRDRSTIEPTHNVSNSSNRTFDPSNYVDEIVAGFDATYRHTVSISIQDSLRDSEGPIAQFEGVRVRSVFRSTGTYQTIRERLLEPAQLRSSASRWLEIERLGGTLLQARAGEEMWPLFHREREALCRLDIPRFETTTTSTTLAHDSDYQFDGPEQSGMDRVYDRLATLSPTDRQRQIAYIRLSLSESTSDHQYAEHRERTISDAAHSSSVAVTDGIENSSPEELVEEAVAIGDEIMDAAVADDATTDTWIVVAGGDAQGLDIRPIGETLYEGRTGIAVFFTQLANVTSQEKYAQYATELSTPVAQSVRETPAKVLDDVSLGIGTGVGSLLYAFAVLGAHLDDSYTRTATLLAKTLTEARIESANHVDVIHGVAGCLLGLLALAGQTNDDSIRERARWCGDRLVEHVSTGEKISTAETHFASGYAHGQAGVAYALASLSASVSDTSYLESARTAVRRENEAYRPSEQNWVDHHLGDDEGQVVDSWCHGRAGIGLARLGAATVTDESEFLRDTSRALAYPTIDSENALAATDQLCCGTAGRIAFSLTAGRRLSRPDAVSHAEMAAEKMAQRARNENGYRYHADDAAYNPTLFQGTAGIGYQLLRVAHPETVPPLLLWAVTNDNDD